MSYWSMKAPMKYKVVRFIQNKGAIDLVLVVVITLTSNVIVIMVYNIIMKNPYGLNILE